VSQVTFTGSPAAKLISKLPLTQRGVGQLLMMKEGQNGRAKVTFVQDTLVALLPKAMVSRSKTELSEVGFLEILESALIYFTAPMLGGPVFKKVFGSMLPKGIDPALLTKPIKEVPKDKLRHVLPAKAGVIVTALVLTGIGGEYIINYARNLMTARVFKKDKFSDVVNLSNGELKAGEQSSVVDKSWKRIYQVIGACAGIFGLSLAGVKYAPKIMSEGFIRGPLKSLVKFFDFQFVKGAYGLTKNQMGAYMALSVPAYIDSARDGLEKWESATRLGIVLPYLLWGQDWIEGLIREKFSSITRCGKDGVNRVLSLEELAKESIEKAIKKGCYSVTDTTNLSKLDPKLLQAAAQEFRRPLRDKAMHVGIPLGVGILGTGIGIGLLNRYWTKYRFEKQQKEQNCKNHVFVAPPLGNIMPLLPSFQYVIQGYYTQPMNLAQQAPTVPAFANNPNMFQQVGIMMAPQQTVAAAKAGQNLPKQVPYTK
jgi:hypothetical protein